MLPFINEITCTCFPATGPVHQRKHIVQEEDAGRLKGMLKYPNICAFPMYMCRRDKCTFWIVVQRIHAKLTELWKCKVPKTISPLDSTWFQFLKLYRKLVLTQIISYWTNLLNFWRMVFVGETNFQHKEHIEIPHFGWISTNINLPPL